MKKTPFVTLEQLKDIEKTYPTPYHIYDEKGIRENARRLNEAFAWNKGFKEYFAVKATPNPYIMQILKEEGCGSDCSSYTELLLAESVGNTGRDIMFSSNCTPPEDFALALKLGAIINLDDITGDAKYGMTHEQIIEAYKILMSKGVKHFGIHSFLASNTVSNAYYPELARQLFALAVELKEKTGASIEFINLSGGIGTPYSPHQSPNDIAIIGEGVHRQYNEILVPAGIEAAIFTELGRYMLAPYGHLVTKAVHRKETYKHYIGVDACACNLMRPAMYGAYHHITVMGKDEDGEKMVYDVTGSLCENNDKFAIDRELPIIDIGDFLVIHDTGAHGFSMGYNYNGKLRSAELLLQEDGTVKMIRRAETPADYFATFDFEGATIKVKDSDE